MAEYALRLENSTDTAPRVRQGDTLPMYPRGALNARNGLRPDGGGVVSVVAGSMSVQVTPFSGWVDGGASDAQGGYPFVSDTTKTLTITAGDATQARVDTVVAEVQDTAFDGSGATQARVRVVQGIPGAGAPALPTSCVPLRDVNVPAGTSAGTGGLSASNLGSDRRTYTAALGGVLPVSSLAERDALVVQNGACVYRLDAGVAQLLTPNGWRTLQMEPIDGLPLSASSAALMPGLAETGWTADPTDLRLSFQAPFSGRVKVTYTVYLVNTAADGSPTNVRAGLKVIGAASPLPTDGQTVAARGGGVGGTYSNTYVVSGLTSGATYALQALHKADSGASMYVGERNITVERF